ncbi:MAG TPA: tetratricopeptide repeat protein [Verrucomicrobiae bacterium]|nr:tetratricopeptide repeat protein [Verrucomicrobiae bacterium]
MVGSANPSEEGQLAQTIEMFEVITQSQPQDYQSLEILKEAYAKLGREQDVLRTAKRIAQAYVAMGQLSSAILEYESILQRYPDDADVLTALSELESKANSLGAQPSLTEVPRGQTTFTRKKSSRSATGDGDDGRQMMQKIFVDSKVINAAAFDQCWVTPDFNSAPGKPLQPFIQNLAEKGLNPLEKSLRLLSEKSRLGFLPLEKYDIDLELGRNYPSETCFRWFVLPFDKMSKSIMVATCNPFNRQAAAEVEEVTKSRIIWYLASPDDISKCLKKVYR